MHAAVVSPMNKLHLEKPLEAAVLSSRGGLTQNTLRREICVLISCFHCGSVAAVAELIIVFIRNNIMNHEAFSFCFPLAFSKKDFSVDHYRYVLCLYEQLNTRGQLRKYRKMPPTNSHRRRDDRNQLKDIVMIDYLEITVFLKQLNYSIFFYYYYL